VSAPGFRRYDPAGIAPPEGHYTHALAVPAGAQLLFVSGQIPVRPDGIVPEGFEAQCEVAWDNVLAALASAGAGPEHLVKVTTYLTDRSQADANGRIRRTKLGAVRPALTVVVVETLLSAWLLEIEAVAVVGSAR
jgi:enamine deaminase RidA (YjgF/YER057c/UK114 family)